MKKGFIHHNGIVQVHKEDEGLVETKVRPKIYAMKFHPEMGYYLQEEKTKYNVGKIYGKTQTERATRIINAFKDSSKNLGVLLSGTKGTGKTVLIKLIANIGVQELQVPVITINQEYSGDSFNSFIEDIGECILLFDEFTKVYRTKEDQEKLLTLFDGLNSAKRLSILTSNEPNQVSQFFIDRPGRILYHFEYTNLDRETFDGYIADNLVATHYLKHITRSYENATMFSFDMLQTLVKECNMNPEMDYRDITIPLNITELRSTRWLKFIQISQPENVEKSQEAITISLNELTEEYNPEEYKNPDEILLKTFGAYFDPNYYVDRIKALGNKLPEYPEAKENENQEEFKDRFNKWRKDKEKLISKLLEQPVMDEFQVNFTNMKKQDGDMITYFNEKTGVTLILQEVWR